jgi:hypothetical protein
MKSHHIFFYILKVLILILLILISLKIIPLKNKLFVLIEFIFKFSIGIFIIVFFANNNCVNLDKHDRIIIILSGFILITLIDYIEVINILFNKHIKDERHDNI